MSYRSRMKESRVKFPLLCGLSAFMEILGRKISVLGGGMKKIEFILPYAENRNVLDLGVVQHDISKYELDNWMHRHLHRVARRCVGVDIVEEGIEVLRERGYDVRVGDAQNLHLEGIETESFDLVVAGDLIEHLADSKGFFESVHRYLKPGGRFIVTTPNPWFALRFVQAARGNVYENVEHTCWYSMGTLREMLSRHGLEVERAVYGSSEPWLWRLRVVPEVMRHTSVFFVARRPNDVSG